MKKPLWLVCLALFGLGAVVGRELPVPIDARRDDARAIRERHPDTEAATRRLPSPVTPALRKQILADREKVWRAWFANDEERLEVLIPNEAVAINAGQQEWEHKEDILASSEDFVQKGGKLVDLQFPRTEIQLYGDVAVLYTTYAMTTEVDGRVEKASGRGTEIFVRRDGRWVNPGWHLDSGS